MKLSQGTFRASPDHTLYNIIYRDQTIPTKSMYLCAYAVHSKLLKNLFQAENLTMGFKTWY